MNKQTMRHGELLLHPTELPEGAVLVETLKEKVVAHSESGHHHVLTSTKDFKVFSWNGDTYIEVPEIAKLWHKKTGKDVHKTHVVKSATYKVILKKQYDYFQKKMVQVSD